MYHAPSFFLKEFVMIWGWEVSKYENWVENNNLFAVWSHPSLQSTKKPEAFGLQVCFWSCCRSPFPELGWRLLLLFILLIHLATIIIMPSYSWGATVSHLWQNPNPQHKHSIISFNPWDGSVRDLSPQEAPWKVISRCSQRSGSPHTCHW